MRTAWASSLRRLEASLLAVMLCAVLVQPAHAITSSNHFMSAVPVTEKTAYTAVFEGGAQAYTGLFCKANPINGVDPSGNDDLTLGSLLTAGIIGAGLDGFTAAATLGAETAAEVTVEGTADVLEVETEGALETEGESEVASEVESGAESNQGQWVTEKLNSARAEAYEQQVTEAVGGEARAGEAYELNGVKFDGIDSEGNLIETKGPGYAKLFGRKFAQSVKNKIIEQMRRQVVARAGKKIIWHIAEKDAMPVFQDLVTDANAKGIVQVVLTPFIAP